MTSRDSLTEEKQKSDDATEDPRAQSELAVRVSLDSHTEDGGGTARRSPRGVGAGFTLTKLLASIVK